jgi:hypothetical protein
VHYIRQKVAITKQNSTAFGLFFTSGGESDIDPTGKEIFSIPFGFAVTQED